MNEVTRRDLDVDILCFLEQRRRISGLNARRFVGTIITRNVERCFIQTTLLATVVESDWRRQRNPWSVNITGSFGVVLLDWIIG